MDPARGAREHLVDDAASRRRQRIAALVLVAATIAAYVPALRAGYVWDDDAYLTDNASVRARDGLARIWLSPAASPQYYPLVFTAFWIEYRLWGTAPAGYHAVNVVLHAASALLLWRLLRALALRGAWIAAAVFALHPVHVESVAWIAERKNVLSGLLYLGAAFWLVRALGLAVDGREENPTVARDWARGAALFVAALLAKTVTATLPAALLVVAWWKRGRIGRREIALTAPLLLLGVAAGLFTAWLERHHVGARGEEWDLAPLERMLVAGRALWFYAGKLVLPRGLAFNYPRFEVDAAAMLDWAFPLGALALLALALALRERWGRGPAAALLFFGLTLFPALGFVDVYPFRYSFVADHFQYLASIGPIALGAAAAVALHARLARPLAGASLACGILALAALGGATWRHAHTFHDLETLWSHTLERNPRSWMAHNNLGNILGSSGRTAEAIEHYHAALAIKPDNPRTHFNLAVVLARAGRTEEAIEQYERTLALDPDHADAHNNLGNVLAASGRFEEAARAYREVLRIRPLDASAHSNLGNTLASTGRYAEAIEQYSAALRLDPAHAQARANLELARKLAAGAYEEPRSGE